MDFQTTAETGVDTFVPFNFFNTSGDANSVSAGLFRVKSNLSVNWSYGDWSVFYQARYIAGYEEACPKTPAGLNLNDVIVPGDVPAGFQWCQYASPAADNPDGELNRRHIGGVTYHDIQGQYHLADYDTTFTLGVQNLFDKTPPLSALAFANSFNSSYYDGAGQRWYFSVAKRF